MDILTRHAAKRLRALHDLRILRADMGDAGLIELVRYGLASRRYIPHAGRDSFKCDYIITPHGETVASQAFRPSL